MVVTKRSKKRLIFLGDDSGELESFTLIHADEYEKEAFLKELESTHSGYNFREIFSRPNFKFVYHYELNESIINLFNKLAEEHRDSGQVKNFQYNLDDIIAPIEGTACLVRNPLSHVIYIIRKEDNLNNLNKIGIDDDRKAIFFRDCKRTKHFKNHNKKYYLSKKDDPEMYNYWSFYMNSKYLALKKYYSSYKKVKNK